MKAFFEWIEFKNKKHFNSSVFAEQGNVPVVIPNPIEFPPGSGRYFYKLQDPKSDDPNKMITIDASLPDVEDTVEKIVAQNIAKGKPAAATKSAAQTAASLLGAFDARSVGAMSIPMPQAQGMSLINPAKYGDLVDIGVSPKINLPDKYGKQEPIGSDGKSRKISLDSRNIMLKRMVAARLKKPFQSLTDQEVNWEIAVMAKENDEPEFMQLDGKKMNLKAVQQQFVDKYGFTPEEQAARGATRSMMRISPDNDWTGIKIKKSRLAGRQAVPRGATVVDFAGRPVDANKPTAAAEPAAPAASAPAAQQPAPAPQTSTREVNDMSYTEIGQKYSNDPAEMERLLKKKIQLDGGIDRLPDLVASAIVNMQQKNKLNVLTSEDAKKLLNRGEGLVIGTEYLKQLAGVNTKAAPAAENPAAVEKSINGQPQQPQKPDITEEIEEVENLFNLFKEVDPSNNESMNQVYAKNKAAFNAYANKKGIEQNPWLILRQLIADDERLQKEIDKMQGK